MNTDCGNDCVTVSVHNLQQRHVYAIPNLQGYLGMFKFGCMRFLSTVSVVRTVDDSQDVPGFTKQQEWWRSLARSCCGWGQQLKEDQHKNINISLSVCAIFYIF